MPANLCRRASQTQIPDRCPLSVRGRDVIRRREPIRRLALIMWKTGTRLDATLSFVVEAFAAFRVHRSRRSQHFFSSSAMGSKGPGAKNQATLRNAP